MIHTDGTPTIANAPAKPFDVVGFIIAFESGEVTEEELIEGFQHLIDTGQAWSLQGFYGRTAQGLIEAGLCTDSREVKLNVKPINVHKIGTFCECGAPYDPEFGGYTCAR